MAREVKLPPKSGLTILTQIISNGIQEVKQNNRTTVIPN